MNRIKLQWYGQVFRSSSVAKTILQDTVKGEGDKADRKRWEDNIRKWTGLEFTKSQQAVENEKMKKTGCEVIIIMDSSFTAQIFPSRNSMRWHTAFTQIYT